MSSNLERYIEGQLGESKAEIDRLKARIAELEAENTRLVESMFDGAEAIVMCWQSEGMEDCSVDLHVFSDWEDAENWKPSEENGSDRQFEMHHTKSVTRHHAIDMGISERG